MKSWQAGLVGLTVTWGLLGLIVFSVLSSDNPQAFFIKVAYTLAIIVLGAAGWQAGKELFGNEKDDGVR